MNKRSFTPVFVIIITFAAFGLIYTIVKQPFELIQRIFFILLFVGVFYGIYKLYTRNSQGGNAQAAYMKAVKHSKKRFNGRSHDKKVMNKNNKKVSPFKKQRVNLEKKKSELHLTVIEGKKGKKKNRASF